MAEESKTGILGRLPPLPRPALNNSVIGMEQAYRQRKGLPLLTADDIEALKAGQPMPWEVGGSSPAPSSAPQLLLTNWCSRASRSNTGCVYPAATAETISEEVASGGGRRGSGASPR
jgi:hypothetical protein